MRNRRSPKYELADELLRDTGGLETFVAERRLRYSPVSWEDIADEIASMTDERVAVSGITLSKWFKRADNAPGRRVVRRPRSEGRAAS